MNRDTQDTAESQIAERSLRAIDKFIKDHSLEKPEQPESHASFKWEVTAACYM